MKKTKRDKTKKICNRLRQQIISGDFKPGARLPSQATLIKDFSASNVTIQNVMKALAKQGYVDARGNCGTFVSEKPPFLRRIALLSPQEERHEASFFRCFIKRGKEISKELGCELELFSGYEGWKGFEDYHRLVDQMKSGDLAGIIFAANPYILNGTPLVEYPDIPRVAFMEGGNFRNIDSVWVDYRQLIDKALDYFLELGRKRIGIICPQVNLEHYFDFSVFDTKGIKFFPHLIQAVALSTPFWAENVVRLMMTLPKKDRPDALLIADDNLVWHATKVLKEMNIKVPDDIAIIGHANFPEPLDSALPIRRMGFDLDECIRHCINTILARRKGEPVKKRYILPALFDSEMI